MSTTKPSTFVKSYFAQTMHAAMEQARVELGTEALLLKSREAPPEARHLGLYEVVFATVSEPDTVPVRIVNSDQPRRKPASPRIEALRREVMEIRKLLAGPRSPSDIVAQTLVDAGVDHAVACEIEEAVSAQIAKLPGNPDILLETSEQLARRFNVAPEIGRVTALIGPPGSGKTTTLVKLAIKQGVARGRAVHLICADTQRIGAAEELRAYAGILGAAFTLADTPAALAQAIDAAPADSLVLIDTPGYSAVMLQDLGGDLAAFLKQRQEIDAHLVLTASMRIEDLYNTVELYGAFGPSKLIFTHLDETSSMAAVFCVASRSQKAVSYLCAGQSIPEDLEPAATEKIVESLVRQLPSVMKAAA